MNLLALFHGDRDLVTLAADDVLFAEGDAGDAMYVLLEGEIALSVRGHEVARIEPGELLGEMALLDAEPRSATATARSPAKLARIDERRFGFLVQQTPFFALHVMRVIGQRLRRMDDRIS